jgi:hypothetical protein
MNKKTIVVLSLFALGIYLFTKYAKPLNWQHKDDSFAL